MLHQGYEEVTLNRNRFMYELNDLSIQGKMYQPGSHNTVVEEMRWQAYQYSPYNSDLAYSDFYRFGLMKESVEAQNL
jgi:hypothetical protein